MEMLTSPIGPALFGALITPVTIASRHNADMMIPPAMLTGLSTPTRLSPTVPQVRRYYFSLFSIQEIPLFEPRAISQNRGYKKGGAMFVGSHRC